MKCHECGGEYQPKKGSLRKKNKFIGSFIVEDVEYLECLCCKDRLFAPEEAKKISEARKAAMQKALMKKPIEDFVTGKKVLELLGFTRQALNQSKKIQRGLLFQLRFNGRIYYLKKSVELFIETGDGRFRLVPEEAKPAVEAKIEIAGNSWKIIKPTEVSFFQLPDYQEPVNRNHTPLSGKWNRHYKKVPIIESDYSKPQYALN